MKQISQTWRQAALIGVALLVFGLCGGCAVPGADQNEARHYGTNTVSAEALQPDRLSEAQRQALEEALAGGHQAQSPK